MTEFTIGAEASCTDGVCGEVTRVVVDPGAAVHDENAWSFANTVRIDRKKPIESDVAVTVDDLFGL